MSYKKPLLVELFVDVRFASGQLDDGAAFAAVERLRAGGLTQIELTLAANLDAMDSRPSATSVLPRVRCWSPDRTMLAQVGRDQVIANQVGPYLGWRKFTDHVRAVLGAVGSLSAVSVALQTIDVLTVSSKGFTLGRYFSCAHWIPKAFEKCSEPCDVSLGRGYLQTDGVNRQLKLQLRIEGEQRTVRIDSTYHDLLNGMTLAEKLEALHEESNRVFEELITSETRDIMGGLVYQ